MLTGLVTALLTGLLALFVLLLLLLAIPVTLSFDLAWPAPARNDLRLRWAFGLVNVRIAPRSAGAGAQRAAQATEPKPAGRASRGLSGGRHVLGLVRDAGARRRVACFLRDLWRAVRKRDVRLHARVGLGDPADTGRLWMLLGPLAALLGNVRDAAIEIEPELFDAALELDGRGSVSINPLQLLYLTTALALSPRIWRAIWRARRTQS